MGYSHSAWEMIPASNLLYLLYSMPLSLCFIEPFFPKLECGEEGICLKVFLLLMPTDLLEEGS